MTPSQAIAYLKAQGMTEAAIAAKVGCGQPTINRIANGKRKPSWAIGKALVELAGPDATPLPRRKKAA